jgi:DNA-binding LytR/AlgR family response regulator
MITALIADDETHARERLRELLDRFDLFEIIAEAKDGNEALQAIIIHRPEVAFLDINMPGVSVFQSIPSLKNPPLIVFQTAYSEHAADAFTINALDYLLKPIRFERLEKAVAKIIEKRASTTPSTPGSAEPGTSTSLVSLRKPHAETSSAAVSKPNAGPVEARGGYTDQVTVTVGGKTRIIASKDIIRISFEDGFCNLYTAQEKLISDKYLNYYEEKLNGGNFFRTSRTDIINLSHISMIHKEYQGSYSIKMRNGMQIDLSRRKAQQLKKVFDF